MPAAALGSCETWSVAGRKRCRIKRRDWALALGCERQRWASTSRPHSHHTVSASSGCHKPTCERFQPLQWGLVDWARAFVYEGLQPQPPPGEAPAAKPPYGLAYNWTVAALEKAW